jgi:DNA-binding transcriptional ArsR family regulator
MRKSIEALFPKVRSELLAILVLHPDTWWFLSDLAKHLRLTPSTLQRELGRLTEAGILTRRVDGKRVYFKADEVCPFLSDLQGLFIKTSGLVDVVRDALKPLRKRIETALIFGSIARGEELSRSDIDLLVVGELGLADLAPALKKAETRLKREVQAIVYRPAEFRSKVRGGEHFVTSVLAGPRLQIIGSLSDDVEAARE